MISPLSQEGECGLLSRECRYGATPGPKPTELGSEEKKQSVVSATMCHRDDERQIQTESEGQDTPNPSNSFGMNGNIVPEEF